MSFPLTIAAGASLPLPGDPNLARLGFERAASGPPILQRLAQEAEGRQLLAAIFGNSPFLSQALFSEPDILEAFLAQDPAAVLADLMAALKREAASADNNQITRVLRRSRRRAALLIALADIAGHWSLEQVTGALTGFADTALGLAIDHLLRRAAIAGDLALGELERPNIGSGLVVLGMGKLGAHELNYSSDIDLIVLYDRDKSTWAELPDAAQKTGKRKVAIKTGISNGANTELLEGLQEGQEVILQ